MVQLTRRTLLAGFAASAVAGTNMAAAVAAPNKGTKPDNPNKGRGNNGGTPTPTPSEPPAGVYGPWEPIGIHPSVEAHLPWAPSGAKTLYPYQGKVYLGYGNWSTNSGSASKLGVDIAWYDPATGQFGTDAQGLPGEAVEVFREYGGKLFIPNTDPRGSVPGSFFSNVTGAWIHGPGTVAGEHMFDVTDSPVPGEYFLVGSDGKGTMVRPTVWRTTDYGQTFEVFFQEPEEALENRDGYERFYWIARLGDKLYVRANNGSKTDFQTPPLRVFDLQTRTWGTVNAKLGKRNRDEFARSETWTDTFAIHDGRLYSRHSGWSGYYAWFDGKKAGLVEGVTNYVNAASPADDGRHLIKQQDGVVLTLNGTSANRIATGAGRGITMLNGKLYTTINKELHVAEPA